MSLKEYLNENKKLKVAIKYPAKEVVGKASDFLKEDEKFDYLSMYRVIKVEDVNDKKFKTRVYVK